MSDQDERKERALRQWAAKIISDLPADDGDCRKVLAYASELMESFLASKHDVSNERRALN